MKRMLLILGGVILVVALLAACKGGDGIVEEAKGGPHVVTPAVSPASGDTQTEPDDPIDGGVIDSTDPDAPKTIQDTRIISFSCRFSTLDDGEPGMLGNHIYDLTAKLENGAVKGSYEVRDTDLKRTFRADHSFMNELQTLVEMYEIARFNGHFVEVQGLPGDYGADLTVKYASGESITGSDNEELFLPYTFLESLNRLFFGQISNNGVQKLDYDTTYPLDPMTTLWMGWAVDEDLMEGVWTLTVNGLDYPETFYGVEPEVWLLRRNRQSFLYLDVPTGDVSFRTRIYAVSYNGPAFLREVEMTLRDEPEPTLQWMEMTLNEPVQDGPVGMLPHGRFRLDGNGLPEFAGEWYDLDGPWVALKQSGRYHPDDRESAAVSGGMWTLAAGQRLRPYRTDLESWVDFITDDDRVVRFTIDKWGDDMHLDNFGTLADVFTEGNG